MVYIFDNKICLNQNDKIIEHKKDHDTFPWKSRPWPWDSYKICVTEDYEYVHSPDHEITEKLQICNFSNTMGATSGAELVAIPLYSIMSSPPG